jgi:hypothetical protein
MRKMGTEKRTASRLYAKQNTLLHKAFAAAGMPYRENKGDWLSLMAEICKRPVGGLSELSLSERASLLNELQKRGQRIFAPAVPAEVKGWKKGDPDVEYGYRRDPDPQVRMIYAMWAEMGYPQKTLRGLAWKLFRRDDVRWLDDAQLRKLVNVVKKKAQSKGYGVYYKRA